MEGRSQQVISISSGSLCSHLQAHVESVVEVHETVFSNSGGPPILASTLLALAVGSQTLIRPLRLRGKRLLVVVEPDDQDLGRDIEVVAQNLGMHVTLLSSPLMEHELHQFYVDPAPYTVAGVRDARETTILRSLASSTSARVLLWNHPKEGIAHLTTKDPYVLGDAIRSALTYHSESPREPSVIYVQPVRLLDTSLVTATVSQDIFDPRVSYLLVGGVGSIGLHVALWMYQVSVLSLNSQ